MAPLDLDDVTVTIWLSGHVTAFQRIEDESACGDARAWYFDDLEAPSRALLCPQACAFTLTDGDRDLEIFIGCGEACGEDDAGCRPI